MKVISESAGFSLMFDSDKDLAATIKNLRGLRKFRKKQKTRSWPAFLGMFVDHPNNKKYARAELRYLRYKLGEKKFSD
jgi:hypothetical protein